MIQNDIARLVRYALSTKLIDKEDSVWAANRLLKLMGEDELSKEAEEAILSHDPEDESVTGELPDILSALCGAAV